MTDALAGIVPAFALGFALGAAPGPVQVLILSESGRRGFGGGIRVMLGANLTLLAILVVLALGFSLVEPTDAFLRVLQVAGGAVLSWIAVGEIRRLRTDAAVSSVEVSSRRLGPSSLGIVSVLLNPGAWVFFGTTASAVIADASSDAGRKAALLTAVAMTVGVSTSDLTFTLLGSGGRRLFGRRGLRWIRTVLALSLGAIGAAFIVQGLVG